jgi:hypothetical protein
MSEEATDLLAVSALPSNKRPYRSHRFPACDFCRHRKSRCTRDLDNGPCLLCCTNTVECIQTRTKPTSESLPAANRKERTRQYSQQLRPDDSPSVMQVKYTSRADDDFSNKQTPPQSRQEQVFRERETHTPGSLRSYQETKVKQATSLVLQLQEMCRF